MRAIRWPRCMPCWLSPRRRGCWCSITRRTKARWRSSSRLPGRAGPGADYQPEPGLDRGAGAAGAGPGSKGGRGFPCHPERDPDRESALELAGQLGGLPLALEQAAAYLRATGKNLAGYLALFGRRRGDLLARGEPAGYGKTVAATWTLAFDQLEQSEPRATSLLRLLAFCAPEPIPLSLLMQPRPGLAAQLDPEVASVLAPLLDDELAVDAAMEALLRYSLVGQPADGLVSVHRLVQAVTAEQMPPDLVRAWQRAAAALVEAALPGDPSQPRAWPQFAVLFPHAQAALAGDSAGLARIASHLGYSGSYIAARDLHQSICTARERVLGPEHPDTLISRGTHARLTGEAGDAAGARNLFAALLPVEERTLGPEHRYTLTARSDLAYWTGEAGDAAGARDQFAALLPVAERVLGPEHPDSLVTRQNVARWTGMAGDAARARDQFAALLPVAERVLGSEHPDTLNVCSDLARWTGEGGDAAGARDQFAALLPLDERVLGPEHPDTLTARHNLARWTGMAGDAAGARDQYAALLPVEQRVLGPEHPDTLATRANLAHWAGKTDSGATPATD